MPVAQRGLFQQIDAQRAPAIRFWLGCAIVGLLGLIVRLDFLKAWQATPLFAGLVMDAATYDGWARAFASGADWTDGLAYPRAPLYIWFVGSVYAVAGPDTLLPRLIQVLVGSVSCVLTAVLGRRFLPPAVALAGAALTALSWPLVFLDAQLLYPALIVVLELAFLLAVPRGDTGVPRSGLAGALLGATALVNPPALLVLPPLAWHVRRVGGRWLHAMVFVCACLLALAPVAVRNRLAGGEWVLISGNGGYNFFVGNNADADGLSVWSSERAIQAGQGVPRAPGAASAHYLRLSGRWIAGHPGDWLALLARKAYYLVNAREIPSNYPLEHVRAVAPSLAGAAAGWLGFGLIGPLALYGCALLARRPQARAFLIYLVVSAAGIVAFFVNARYRAPLLPLLNLAAAFAVAELVSSFRRGPRDLFLQASPLLLLLPLVNSSLAGVDDRRQEAPLHVKLGMVYFEAGALDPAEAEFRLALALDPERVGYRHLLATTLVRRGQLGEAEAQFGRVVAEIPEHVEAWNSLGNLALIRKDATAAAAAYRRALEIEPGYEAARAGLRAAERSAAAR